MVSDISRISTALLTLNGGDSGLEVDWLSRLSKWFYSTLRRKPGSGFQGYALCPCIVVFDNIVFSLEAKRGLRDDQGVSCLGVQYSLYRKPVYLSSGERRGGVLARALIENSEFLLMKPS